jgi:hypothetical protein
MRGEISGADMISGRGIRDDEVGESEIQKSTCKISRGGKVNITWNGGI